MLKIRRRYFNKFISLQRKGSKNFPVFSIILRFHIKNSKIFIEKLGHYNPNFTVRKFFFNSYRLAY
jgi:ribosomal protein S16